jgi:hypothetical protein
MRASTLQLLLLLLALFLTACASQWKIHGGPKECVNMCKNWDMELVGMVGVGSQGRSSEGATACVCQPSNRNGDPAGAGGATAASLGGPITAAQAATAAQMAAQQQQQPK